VADETAALLLGLGRLFFPGHAMFSQAAPGALAVVANTKPSVGVVPADAELDARQVQPA
jgi:hypothetical protein